MGFWQRRADERAVRQWRRELDRGLEQPLDPAELAPSPHRLDGPLPPTDPRTSRRSRRRERQQRGALLPGLLVVAAVLGFLALTNPGTTRYWADEVVRRATGGTSSSYAFMRVTTATGVPVSWDHCRPLRYQVDPTSAPDDWQQLVDSAVQVVAEASELDLVDVGTTHASDRGDPSSAPPVLISWGTPSQEPELAGDVAGLGGSSGMVVDGRVRWVTGSVLLDAGDYARMAELGEDDAMRMILVHELLHVIGLDHVDDRRQLMYPSYLGQGGLGDGDREGLQVLHDQRCT